MLTNWLKQDSTPLFKELEWSKPERRDQAGSLLIIGGTAHSLHAPARAYETVLRAGVGRASVVLPDKARKLVAGIVPDALFLPSTSTGEFSKEGEHELIEHSLNTDGLLLPGDVGKNSQTSILLESLLRSYSGPAIISGDSIESLLQSSDLMLQREQTSLIVSFTELQKLFQQQNNTQAITSSMDLVQFIEHIHNMTQTIAAAIIVMHHQKIVVAYRGNISTTPIKSSDSWREKCTAYAACYQVWNPHKQFEALTHAAHQLAT